MEEPGALYLVPGCQVGRAAATHIPTPQPPPQPTQQPPPHHNHNHDHYNHHHTTTTPNQNPQPPQPPDWGSTPPPERQLDHPTKGGKKASLHMFDGKVVCRQQLFPINSLISSGWADCYQIKPNLHNKFGCYKRVGSEWPHLKWEHQEGCKARQTQGQPVIYLRFLRSKRRPI